MNGERDGSGMRGEKWLAETCAQLMALRKQSQNGRRKANHAENRPYWRGLIYSVDLSGLYTSRNWSEKQQVVKSSFVRQETTEQAYEWCKRISETFTPTVAYLSKAEH